MLALRSGMLRSQPFGWYLCLALTLLLALGTIIFPMITLAGGFAGPTTDDSIRPITASGEDSTRGAIGAMPDYKASLETSEGNAGGTQLLGEQYVTLSWTSVLRILLVVFILAALQVGLFIVGVRLLLAAMPLNDGGKVSIFLDRLMRQGLKHPSGASPSQYDLKFNSYPTYPRQPQSAATPADVDELVSRLKSAVTSNPGLADQCMHAIRELYDSLKSVGAESAPTANGGAARAAVRRESYEELKVQFNDLAGCPAEEHRSWLADTGWTRASIIDEGHSVSSDAPGSRPVYLTADPDGMFLVRVVGGQTLAFPAFNYKRESWDTLKLGFKISGLNAAEKKTHGRVTKLIEAATCRQDTENRWLVLSRGELVAEYTGNGSPG